jgi:malate permease and related proteins
LQNFLFSLNVTLPIFIIIVVGGFLKRIGLLTEGFTSVADKFVFKVALPVQLFRDIAAMDIRADFSGKFVVFCMVATTCMFAATWILGAIFLKDKSMVGAFAQAAARGSAAILGIAFVENIYGDSGMTPMMIVAAVPLFNIYSVIILTVTSSEGKFNGALVKKLIKGVVTNPIILGIAAGMVWSLLRLPMPVILSKSVNYIATTATPLALLVLGATFKGKEALSKIGPTIAAAFLKLVAIPAAIFPFAIHMGFRGSELVAIMIMLASPTTVTCYIMAKNMGGDDTLSASVVMTATLFSSVTLTLWVFVMKTFGLI